jgi:transcriptional regulator of met regulon
MRINENRYELVYAPKMNIGSHTLKKSAVIIFKDINGNNKSIVDFICKVRIRTIETKNRYGKITEKKEKYCELFLFSNTGRVYHYDLDADKDIDNELTDDSDDSMSDDNSDSDDSTFKEKKLKK